MKRYLSALLALLLALTAAPGLCSEEVTANETGTQLWSPLEAFPDEIVGVCNLISSASSDTYDFLVQDKSRTEEIASASVPLPMPSDSASTWRPPGSVRET